MHSLRVWNFNRKCPKIWTYSIDKIQMFVWLQNKSLFKLMNCELKMQCIVCIVCDSVAVGIFANIHFNYFGRLVGRCLIRPIRKVYLIWFIRTLMLIINIIIIVDVVSNCCCVRWIMEQNATFAIRHNLPDHNWCCLQFSSTDKIPLFAFFCFCFVSSISIYAHFIRIILWIMFHSVWFFFRF